MRGPARPHPSRPETLLRGLYLSNHLTDSLAVFFIGYLHPFYQVFYYSDMWVTLNARATGKNEGVLVF